MTGSTQKILRELIRLRIGSLSKSVTTKRPKASRRFIEKEIRLIYRLSKEKGRLYVLEEKNQLRGAILFFPRPLFHSKKAVPQIRIFLEPKNIKAHSWAKKTLSQVIPLQNEKQLHTRLDSTLQSLLPTLNKLGLAIDSVTLCGRPKVALRALTKKYGPLPWEETGLVLKPLRTRSEVASVLKIAVREFTRNPQFGWMVRQPYFVQYERRALNQQRLKKFARQFVIQKAGRIVGHIGFEDTGTSPWASRTAGMILVFAKEIQGKGLSKYAYMHLLKQMIRLKIDLFFGGTSQVPVMKLARLMKRKRVAFTLRKGKAYFSRSYFTNSVWPSDK